MFFKIVDLSNYAGLLGMVCSHPDICLLIHSWRRTQKILSETLMAAAKQIAVFLEARGSWINT